MSEQLTISAVTRQIQAMGCEIYEVGLYKPGAWSRSGEPEMLPRTWDEKTLIRSISWLRFQNSQGRNIYVRPQGEHSLTLLDDLSRQALEQLRASGFKPALVVETSPDNFQAWLNHGRQLPRELSSATARALADKFGGDPSSADWRHFGRLSGFTNRKPSRARPDGTFPFVKLIEATGNVCEQAQRFVDSVASQVGTRKQEALLRRPLGYSSSIATKAQKTIHDFRNNPLYGGDGNRVDLAYAVYALSRGVSETDVRAAICDRDLTHKGHEVRQSQYIDRTIQKAVASIEGRGR